MSDEPESNVSTEEQEGPKRGRPPKARDELIRNATSTRIGLVAKPDDVPIFIAPGMSEKIEGSRWAEIKKSGAVQKFIEGGALQVA